VEYFCTSPKKSLSLVCRYTFLRIGLKDAKRRERIRKTAFILMQFIKENKWGLIFQPEDEFREDSKKYYIFRALLGLCLICVVLSSPWVSLGAKQTWRIIDLVLGAAAFLILISDMIHDAKDGKVNVGSLVALGMNLLLIFLPFLFK